MSRLNHLRGGEGGGGGALVVVVAGAEAGSGADVGGDEDVVAVAVYDVPTQVDKKVMAL